MKRLLLLLSLANPAFATPVLTTGGYQILDKPGLFISKVNYWHSANNEGRYVFRVYCPTKTLRQVEHMHSDGGSYQFNRKWGTLMTLSQAEGSGYPTGLPTLAVQQICQ